MRAPRKGVIRVDPAWGLERLSSLFAALETCFPVTFLADADRADALLTLDACAAEIQPSPAPLTPRLVVLAGQAREPAAGAVTFAERHAVPLPLRGRTLIERHCAPVASLSELDGVALARIGCEPVWVGLESEPMTRVSSLALEALAPGEPLRAQFRAGRFAALAPLLSLVEQACPEPRWAARPRRACFIVDDPNLHRPTYGNIDYRRLAAEAHASGYHVAIATVPLDSWLIDERAARVFREHPQAVSLLIHGNDHTRHELGRLDTRRSAERALAQALRRAARLERRVGARVGRVMAPPHGACSEHALRAMARLGFEAACISRPYPWLPAGQPLPAEAGWRAADLVAGGMPVLPRHPIGGDPEELLLRAVLGHPLIVYCHHRDLGENGALASAAAQIERMGPVQWLSPEEIARASHRSRHEGGELLVELASARAHVYVPRGCSRLRISAPVSGAEPVWRWVRCGGVRAELRQCPGGLASDALAVAPDTTVEVRLEQDTPLDPYAVRPPRRRAWPLARRTLVEARDRWQARSR